MRTAPAIAIGLVVGAVGAAVVFFAIEGRPGDEPGTALGPAARPPFATQPAVALQRSARASPDLPAQMANAAPSTPDYGPRVAAPPSIFRCRSNGVTTYSNEACAGATVVDAPDAAGYDSRPSERMARLVAQGRTGDDEAPQPLVRRPIARPPVETAECANMRRQIRDIDAEALRLRSARQLDDLRAQRQDIRTGMARSHC